eukprot:6367114-Pyramimonas_sp.AAC.1
MRAHFLEIDASGPRSKYLAVAAPPPGHHRPPQGLEDDPHMQELTDAMPFLRADRSAVKQSRP